MKLRITAKASTLQEAASLIQPVQTEIETRLGNAIYGYDEDSMEDVVLNMLRVKGLRLALAESRTGGRISDLITNVPGASDVPRELYYI